MTTHASALGSRSVRRATVAAVLFCAVVLAFTLGLYGADLLQARTHPDLAAARAWPATPAEGAPGAGVRDVGAEVAIAPDAQRVQAPPPAAPPARAAATPQLVARVTEEARAQLEDLRGSILAHCLPGDDGRGGGKSAKVTFDITFDARGREIARGIRQDRRAPAPQLASCLRMAGKRFSVSPPGTTVAVKVPVTFGE